MAASGAVRVTCLTVMVTLPVRGSLCLITMFRRRSSEYRYSSVIQFTKEEDLGTQTTEGVPVHGVRRDADNPCRAEWDGKEVTKHFPKG
jgi:hypothetical protein